jgi:hypothetical protein
MRAANDVEGRATDGAEGKYAQNDGGHLWQRLTDLDEQAVSMLVDELERLVRDGKVRLRPPGQTG